MTENTVALSNLYPTDPYPQVGESLYQPTSDPLDESLYGPGETGDRWTSIFYPPLIPAPEGALDAITWVQDGTTPLRFLDGVTIRQSNFGLSNQFGVWGEDWCGSPDDTKEKPRPDAVFIDVAPITVYAYDQNQCGDLTSGSREEVRQRVAQIMALTEGKAIETSLAIRLKADAPTTVTAASVTEAVSILETELAKAGVTGYLHASPKWAAYLAESRLSLSGKSPMGHTWVFGGGYADTLEDTIVATTPLYGWRGPLMMRDAIKTELNQYVTVAERSLLIAYEAAVAAVTIAG
jgi:hypothetical protein